MGGNQLSKEFDTASVQITHLKSGAFGEVKLAKISDKKLVVLKSARRLSEEEWLNHEARVQTAGKHENVVNVFGCETISGNTNIVMEYLPNGNLQNRLLNNKQKISFRRRLKMCYDISLGLRHLHNLPSGGYIIHNDIKPDNILLTSDLRCKISDFGCSRVYDADGRFVDGCPVDLFCIPYAAPEKLIEKLLEVFCEGSENVYDQYYTYSQEESPEPTRQRPQTSSDIYSLSILIYCLIYRVLPWQYKDDPNSIASKVVLGERPADKNNLACDREDLPHARFLWNVMVRSWDQNPDLRPNAIYICDVLYLWLTSHGLEDFVN